VRRGTSVSQRFNGRQTRVLMQMRVSVRAVSFFRRGDSRVREGIGKCSIEILWMGSRRDAQGRRTGQSAIRKEGKSRILDVE
jgi:hypothetical protein